MRNYQIETGQVIDENLSPEQKQVEEDPDEPSSPFSDEEQKLVSFLNKTIFNIKGKRGFTAISTKNIF